VSDVPAARDASTPLVDGASAVEEDPTPEPASTAEPLLEPRDGIPEPVADSRGLREAAEALAAGTGPVAVDAERASGYRYGQRAYLVQLRRRAAGTFLVDPLGVDDLAPVGAAIADVEWVLHAASQDLPCLREVGMVPKRIFDTELAGRLLGLPRVGLGPMTEEILGYTLEKGHSAADWSTRPLPEPWLRYAALDVELLVELRDVLEQRLAETGKLEWAHQEFAAILAAPSPAPRPDPWRRTSGMHRVRTRRQLAVVRELWLARDRTARSRDVAPGRVLPDTAIVAAAVESPGTVADLVKMPVFSGRSNRRNAGQWFAALTRARSLTDTQLPDLRVPHEGPPPARSWGERNPDAAARLAAARSAVAAIADEHALPTENLLSPDTVRRLAWDPPEPLGRDAVVAVLEASGARAWQVEMTASALAGALERVQVRAGTDQLPRPAD
jgi:ribonuclease D